MTLRPPIDAPKKMVPFVGKTVGSVDVGVPVDNNVVAVGRPASDTNM